MNENKREDNEDDMTPREDDAPFDEKDFKGDDTDDLWMMRKTSWKMLIVIMMKKMCENGEESASNKDESLARRKP